MSIPTGTATITIRTHGHSGDLVRTTTVLHNEKDFGHRLERTVLRDRALVASMAPEPAPRCAHCRSERTKYKEDDPTRDWRCLDCGIVFSPALATSKGGRDA